MPIYKKCVACAEAILAEAQLCRHCHSRQSDQHPSSEVRDSKSTQQSSVRICPECQSDSNVQRVAAIISSGSSTTNTFGLATQLSNPTNPFIAGSVGRSQTDLARRLTLPLPQPRYGIALSVAVLLFLAIPLALVWSSATAAANSTPFSWNFLLAVIGSAIVFPLLIGGKARETARKRQQPVLKAQEVIDNSFYCFRDDLVYNERFNAKPEVFLETIKDNIWL